MEAQQPHIAILPTPGMGHLIPLVELSRKLVHLHGFSITFILPHDGLPTKPQKAILETFPAINSIFLPPATADGPPEDSQLEARILHSLIQSTPSVCTVLSELKTTRGVSALVVDLFAAITFDAVRELRIPLYIFFTGSAMVLSLCLHSPKLDESSTCEYRDLPEPVELPGCLPVRGSDFPDSVQDRNSEAYKLCIQLCKKFMLAEGILVNTFVELEPDTFKALEKGAGPPVYHVGPVVRSGSGNGMAECLEWLDKQPSGSVLFVSFGSGGTLSTEQLKELCSGLERSQQRFLLVGKRPNDKVRSASYFDVSSRNFEYLPSGLMERTGGKGYVLSDWAPQVEVLSHAAVGGFLTHCGWNSILESIVHGVPLIAWPLFAEQRMNAVLLSEGLKVAVRVKENENGVVDSEQISSLVTRLMEGEEGEELRNRMRNLKDEAVRALTQGGSSTVSLAHVAQKWKSSTKNCTLD